MKWGKERLTSNVSPLVRHWRWQGGRGGHHQPHPLAALHLHSSDIRCLRSQKMSNLDVVSGLLVLEDLVGLGQELQ